MKKIEAKIIADSINPQGDRITTYLLTFPRFILAELNTHRVFSKNSASSRAIPFEKMVEMVETDPFIPIAWQKDHKGMQGIEYIADKDEIRLRELEWLKASNQATMYAKHLNNPYSVTKQLCNRLLEPFMWHTVLLTGTEFENFFKLRCPQYVEYAQFAGGKLVFRSKKEYIDTLGKGDDYSELGWFEINEGQAEIHMMTLAEAMWDAYNESTPKKLESGEWHIPFGDIIIEDDLLPILYKVNAAPGEMSFQKVKIATARCARLSYTTLGDNPKVDYEADINLHDRLLKSHHMSPFEHCARAMSDEEYSYFIKGYIENQGAERENYENGYLEEIYIPDNTQGWCNNFRGFIQYRYLIENNYEQ